MILLYQVVSQWNGDGYVYLIESYDGNRVYCHWRGPRGGRHRGFRDWLNRDGAQPIFWTKQVPIMASLCVRFHNRDILNGAAPPPEDDTEPH